MTTAAICATRELSWRSSFYRGEQFDLDLGLYYLRARYYNPNTGRFMSRDPEDSWPTNSASLHKYLYASGDPVNRIDPRGRGDFVEYVFNLSEQALKAIIPITEMVGNFVELQVVPSVEAGVNFAVEAVEVFAEDVELTKKATAVAKAYVCADLALQFAILVMDLNNDVKLTPEQREIYLTTSEIGMTAVCVEQWR